MARLRLLLGTSFLAVVIFTALSHGLPCTLVYEQQEYDLSSLSAVDHWQVKMTNATGNDTVIYLSVCHPLRNVPRGCSGNDTGACIAKVSSENNVEVTVPNAGRVTSDGLSLHGQLVEYVMGGGDSCPEGGNIYRTFINFICTQTPEEETGPVLMSLTRCQILIAWMTRSACPRRLDVVTDTQCSIQFPSSHHKLHLQTLRAEKFYSASSVQPNAEYEINICGPVMNGSCNRKDVAVCHHPEGRSPEVMATTQNMNVMWGEHETLILTYQASDQGKNVEVIFMCDLSTAKTEVNYMSQNDTTVSFGAQTSAVCPPSANPSCVLKDHVGNVYDLRPLHRQQDNWEVLRSTSDGQEILYYLNICGPVNPGRHFTCPPGLIGACMAGISEHSAYNLGLLNSEPTINVEEDSITIMYNGGEPCKGGQHSYSTRINLICSPDEHGPVLVKETETCEHVFDWLTPVACPRHLNIGSDCRVEDPLYGNVYDLNPLRNIHKDYRVTGEGDEFFINLCGPLVSSCDGQNGTSGVCQISNGQQINAGLSTSQVTFNDGTLIIKYTNGTSGCQANNTRSSQIIFLCDHEVSGRDGPKHFRQNGCSNVFFWKTKYACPSFHVVDCTLYTADGTMYNLQELSSSSSNLEYYTADDKKFILNVCRSVVHQKGSRCAYRAGACIVDRTYHNNSVNIGEVQSGLYLEDGRLMIRYARGDQCVGHERSYQTLIELKCDKDETYPIPQLISEENCTYYFEIKSAAACPVSMKNNTMPLVGKDCAVTSPSGYVFNLSSLKRETDYEIKNQNVTMTLNICGALNNPECPGEGVGICSKDVNAGQANANLYYLPGHLSLHYTGGEQCHGIINRSTIITFVCGAENVTEGPVLVFDDKYSCIYFITWYTELACEKRISCFVDTWTHRIDLSPLIKSVDNYETVNPENPKEKFYLNVCRPLNPIVGLNCRPGSAVCLSKPGLQGNNPLSLGHPNIIPVSDNEGANIMYVHGAKCTTEPDYNLSSMIHFICDPSAGKGKPVFKEVTHDCQYQFEWRTSVACDILFKEEDSGPQCQIRYDQAKANIDLKPLYRPEGYHVQFRSKTFTVNVCGPACNNSGSCSSDGDSYGLSNKSELEWHYGQLRLKYFGGSRCVGSLSGHKTTIVLFECDMSAGFGVPVPDNLMESLDCQAVFNWKTNVTCIEGIYATEDTATSTSSSNSTAGQNSPSIDSLKDNTIATHSTVTAVIGNILVVCGLVLVAGLVLIKSRHGNHIVAATRRLFGIRGYGHARQSQFENSTLLRETKSIRIFRRDDSDDNLIRL
ncbi:cation-independent mannose-6-phosphate receptor-like isoform X1 [Scylla paramamosain]|uniref:cation-independent mannose-6-phosphate receptor-like isoform X1 n=1 Tax=Scylla paramamosain TaxID=85552 RepID=UPI00308331F7